MSYIKGTIAQLLSGTNVHGRVQTPFINSARSDNLVLWHWRKQSQTDTSATAPTAGAVDNSNSNNSKANEPPSGDHALPRPSSRSGNGYYYAKFNVKVQVPEYTDEQYERHLVDDDWTKHETDYLMTLCQEYDLRWVLIADRYEYTGDGQTDVQMLDPKIRSMEDMKTRYYAVASKMMTVLQPTSRMTKNELEHYEKMTAFDPDQELRRKRMAEALLSRTPEEIKEEEVLLAELKRIVLSEDTLLQSRKELYDRLDAPQSTGNVQAHQSSQGLAQLLQTLLGADKNKKRRSAVGAGDLTSAASTGTPGAASGSVAGEREGRQGGHHHRESIGGAGGGSNKKGSVATGERRQLSAREEEIYGVSHHDRLTQGVQFRHDKVNRLAQVKSNVQAQRVTNALTELGIPSRLLMPTGRVCAAYERLMQSIHNLVDIRKVSEKVEAEIKVAVSLKEDRHRRESMSTSGKYNMALNDTEAAAAAAAASSSSSSPSHSTSTSSPTSPAGGGAPNRAAVPIASGSGSGVANQASGSTAVAPVTTNHGSGVNLIGSVTRRDGPVTPTTPMTMTTRKRSVSALSLSAGGAGHGNIPALNEGIDQPSPAKKYKK